MQRATLSQDIRLSSCISMITWWHWRRSLQSQRLSIFYMLEVLSLRHNRAYSILYISKLPSLLPFSVILNPLWLARVFVSFNGTVHDLCCLSR